MKKLNSLGIQRKCTMMSTFLRRKLMTGVNQMQSKCSSNIPVCIEIGVDGNVNIINNPEDIANAGAHLGFL